MSRKLFYPVIIISAFSMLAFSSFKYLKKINCTELNGSGCVCHGLTQATDMIVWCTGPSVLETGTSAVYRVYMAGGPALGGGHNVAVRYGTMDTVDNLSDLIDNELTQSHPLVFPTRRDTLHWDFKITAPDTACIDTLYSCGLSTNNDGAPDIGDEWQYGPKFPIRIVPKVVPVELELLSIITGPSGNSSLSIKVISEHNNRGFSIETADNFGWKQVGFLQGAGTSLAKKEYLFPVTPEMSGKTIRVVQIDYSGKTTVLGTVTAEIKELNTVTVFPLPARDNIHFTISTESKSSVSYTLFNIRGEEVYSHFVTAEQGVHNFTLPARLLSSGVYILSVECNHKKYVQKVILAH